MAGWIEGTSCPMGIQGAVLISVHPPDNISARNCHWVPDSQDQSSHPQAWPTLTCARSCVANRLVRGSGGLYDPYRSGWLTGEGGDGREPNPRCAAVLPMAGMGRRES